MDIQNPWDICEEICNTYTFTIKDKDGKIVNQITKTNYTMPKRYFSVNTSGPSVRLGTMTQSDYRKYQNGNGTWKEGYASKSDGHGGTITNTGSTVANINEKVTTELTYTDASGNSKTITQQTNESVWSFYPKINKDDDSLLGTTVYNISLGWSTTNITSDTVTFHGEATIGYHNPNWGLNDTLKQGIKKSGKMMATVGQNGEMSEFSSNNEYYTIYGIKFFDAGLFSRSTCLSHLTAQFYKRPTDTLTISVDIHFKGLQKIGSFFVPEGSKLFGQSFGTSGIGSTCQLRPTHYGFSGLAPVYIQSKAGGGCVPISPELSFSMDDDAGTDVPNDWVEEDSGKWLSYPKYEWFGKTDTIYSTTTKSVKDGTDENGNPKFKEITEKRLNDKGQKIFNFTNLKERTFIGYNRENFGPVRSFIIGGYGVKDLRNYSSLRSSGVTRVAIGEGDGQRRIFYHGITTEIGRVSQGYGTNAQGNILYADRITHYSKTDNIFCNANFLGIYNDNFELECGANMRNSCVNKGYSKEENKLCMGLHPFTLDYYPEYIGLIGAYSNQWMVYQYNGKIGAAWVGMVNRSTPGGGGISSQLRIRTASTIEGLKAADSKTVYSRSSQHDCTIFNGENGWQSEGFVAVTGDSGWNDYYPYYVGGFRYESYDVSGIRVVQGTEVPGAIIFNEPPKDRTPVYIDIEEFYIPFIYYFTKIKGKFYNKYGSEDMNGKATGY